MDRMVVARELLAMAKELVAMEFPTQDAMDKYLKEHPDADKSLHKVVKTKKQKKQPEQKGERIPVPKFEDIKPVGVDEDTNYNRAVEILKEGQRGEKRLREILDSAKKRPDEIKTTIYQWSIGETMPKDIVDGFTTELGYLPHQIRGIERAIEEQEKGTK